MSLTITYPFKALPISAASSNWFAVNGQLTSVIAQAQRKDSTTNTAGGSAGFLTIVCPKITGIIMNAGDQIYFNVTDSLAGLKPAIYTIGSVSSTSFLTSIQTTTPYYGAGTSTPGYINFLTARGNFYVRCKFFQSDGVSFNQFGNTFLYRPDGTGLAKIDISAIFRNMVALRDTNAHAAINEMDMNLSALSRIQFTQGWTIADVPTDEGYGPMTDFSIVNAAMQMKHLYGSNMADFMPEHTGGDKAKFAIDMKRPTYFPGFPFDVSFLYNNDLNTTTFLKRFYESYVNGLGVAIDDDLLDTSQAKFLNRLLIPKNYIPGVDAINLFLGYDGYGAVERYVAYNYVTDGYFSVH